MCVVLPARSSMWLLLCVLAFICVSMCVSVCERGRRECKYSCGCPPHCQVVAVVGMPCREDFWYASEEQARLVLALVRDLDSTQTYPLPDLGRLSGECLDFARRCLMWDPDKRPSLSALLVHPYLAADPVGDKLCSAVAALLRRREEESQWLAPSFWQAVCANCGGADGGEEEWEGTSGDRGDAPEWRDTGSPPAPAYPHLEAMPPSLPSAALTARQPHRSRRGRVSPHSRTHTYSSSAHTSPSSLSRRSPSPPKCAVCPPPPPLLPQTLESYLTSHGDVILQTTVHEVTVQADTLHRLVAATGGGLDSVRVAVKCTLWPPVPPRRPRDRSASRSRSRSRSRSKGRRKAGRRRSLVSRSPLCVTTPWCAADGGPAPPTRHRRFYLGHNGTLTVSAAHWSAMCAAFRRKRQPASGPFALLCEAFGVCPAAGTSLLSYKHAHGTVVILGRALISLAALAQQHTGETLGLSGW